MTGQIKLAEVPLGPVPGPSEAVAKARVLLVNTNREGGLWSAFPAGFCAVAAATSAAGHDVHTLDLRFIRDPAAAFRRALRRADPDVVGFSIRNIDSVSAWDPVFFLEAIRDELIPACRQASVPSVIGGPAVGVGGQALVDFLDADWGIAGEAEEVFPRLVESLASETPPSALPGLLRRGAPVPPGWHPAQLPDLSRMPPPDPARWVPARRYWRAGTTYPLLTRRGCSFGCVYCSYTRIEGSACRFRSPDAVVGEMRAMVGKGVRRFEIVDSVFGLPESHALAVCDAIRDANLPVRLDVSALHPLAVTPRLLDSLEAAGVRSVLCTPDTFSRAGLDGLAKGFGIDVVARTVRLLAARRFDVCWFLVLGAPGETAESILESLRFVEREIPPHHVVLANIGLRIYPGTPLAELCRTRGLIGPDDPLIRPRTFLEPSLDAATLRAAVEATAARCPNLVFMGEEPRGPLRQALIALTLRCIAGRRPAWAALPAFLRVVSRIRPRDPLPALASPSLSMNS